MSLWRAKSCATFGCTPLDASRVKKVCRSAWKSTTLPASSLLGILAAARSALTILAVSVEGGMPNALLPGIISFRCSRNRVTVADRKGSSASRVFFVALPGTKTVGTLASSRKSGPAFRAELSRIPSAAPYAKQARNRKQRHITISMTARASTVAALEAVRPPRRSNHGIRRPA